MKIYTKFRHENLFTLTTRKDALRLIKEEFEETDEEATLEYVILTCKDANKQINVGDITFKVEK